MQVKNEQLRANLLRSISHDLRTPLTSISGNAGILLNSPHSLDSARSGQLIADIAEDAPVELGLTIIGAQELMVTEHCLLMSQGPCDENCAECPRRKSPHFLRDRKDYEFPVVTDAMGRKADFRNTIVLITSNLGARFLAGQSAPLGFAAGSEAVFEKQAAQAVEEAKKWFRPELVGRLDELIVFRPLSDESMSAIAEKMLCRLEVRAARNGYQLRHTPQVGAVLAARARSAYGARELRRQVDRAVEQALADQIAAGTACTGQHWTADCTAEGTIVLRQDETATL